MDSSAAEQLALVRVELDQAHTALALAKAALKSCTISDVGDKVVQSFDARSVDVALRAMNGTALLSDADKVRALRLMFNLPDTECREAFYSNGGNFELAQGFLRRPRGVSRSYVV
jgi:hypothetical protein